MKNDSHVDMVAIMMTARKNEVLGDAGDVYRDLLEMVRTRMRTVQNAVDHGQMMTTAMNMAHQDITVEEGMTKKSDLALPDDIAALKKTILTKRAHDIHGLTTTRRNHGVVDQDLVREDAHRARKSSDTF
jgi:hypothetical protein